MTKLLICALCGERYDPEGNDPQDPHTQEPFKAPTPAGWRAIDMTAFEHDLAAGIASETDRAWVESWNAATPDGRRRMAESASSWSGRA